MEIISISVDMRIHPVDPVSTEPETESIRTKIPRNGYFLREVFSVVVLFHHVGWVGGVVLFLGGNVQ